MKTILFAQILLAGCCLESCGSLDAPLLDDRAPPPVFNISAKTLFGAGLKHGELAADRIKAWLASDEMTRLLAFVNNDKEGRAAFLQMKKDNIAAYPQYVDEMTGIAIGAGASLDEIR